MVVEVEVTLSAPFRILDFTFFDDRDPSYRELRAEPGSLAVPRDRKPF